MGAMGTIAPTAKKLWAMPPSRPHRNFVVSIFEQVKRVKRFTDFSLKMQQKCLAAGLYTRTRWGAYCAPRSPKWILGVGIGQGNGNRNDRRGEKNGTGE